MNNKRITFGRRRSDWFVPLGFIAVGIGASFWASYNRTRKSDLHRQNEALRVQVKLLERPVDRYEGDLAKSGTPHGKARATAARPAKTKTPPP